MDQSTTNRPSGLPRPSKLPVPRAGLRPAASRENLQQTARSNIVNPRLRSVPSRDQLSSSISSKPRGLQTPSKTRDSSIGPRDRNVSTGTIVHTPPGQQVSRRPSHNTLFRKPSRNFSGDDQVRLDTRGGGEGVFQEDDIMEESERQLLSEAALARGARPSLSERTMETLQSIPSSPAVRKRGSSFFRSNSPMRPPSSGFQSSRPGSSHHSDGSMRPPSRSVSSRPSSSGGSGFADKPFAPVDFRASTNTFRPPQSTMPSQTPVKRSGIGKSLQTPSNIRNKMPPTPDTSTSKHPSPRLGASTQQSPSPVKTTPQISGMKSGSKTLTSRPLKPRASVNGLFRKPSMPALDKANDIDRIGFVPQKKLTTFSNTSSEAMSTTSKFSAATSPSSASGDNQDITPRKSSMALRDQIAKAKAAKKAAAAKLVHNAGANSEEVPVIASGTFDFGLSDDPFNQQIDPNNSKGILRKRIDAARSDGRLNIAAMGFKEIPEEVLNMYDTEAMDGSWAEAVDLTRFIAAGNELELLHDDVFPDIDPRDNVDDEDAKGNQFGGLETLDLHGNILIALPLGLRRLELLTTLNISNNKLGNECFEVISQIPSLRDLKIGGNELAGSLDERISTLQKLETLDLHGNALTSLPEGLAELVHLRVLNLTQNSLTSIPFTTLRNLPIIELLAAKNKLAGALVSADVEGLPHLQLLDVTANSLTCIAASGQLSLPSLHQLSCSSNRLVGLPDLSSWASLLTITAEDNSFTSIPEGFVGLPKVKNVNFSGNNIKVIDDEIGGMDNLDIFRIGGNPLRDKKFSGMNTADLKRALKARLAPPEHEKEKELDSDGGFYSAPVSPVSPSRSAADWPVKAGGILDRSNTQSHSLNPVSAAEVASRDPIKVLELHHNKFNEIPTSIAFFAATLTSLTLAHNELTSDTFMKDDIEMPVLKELNLSSNTFNSLLPLIRHLQAPQLERLDISFNRLTSLPPLRPYFPNLTMIFASNNTIRELSPESVKGLRTLDCSSNDINSLNARIGLLGGPGGLERLNVSGNRFRVPKYTVLDKGTEATLQWLRDRIPAGEASPPTTPNDVD